MLVEDIQDVIEDSQIYRYNKSTSKKTKNTTDESILGLIKTKKQRISRRKISNKNAVLASTQRDYIAGEVSKDLTKRLLLPEK